MSDARIAVLARRLTDIENRQGHARHRGEHNRDECRLCHEWLEAVQDIRDEVRRQR